MARGSETIPLVRPPIIGLMDTPDLSQSETLALPTPPAEGTNQRAERDLEIRLNLWKADMRAPTIGGQEVLTGGFTPLSRAINRLNDLSVEELRAEGRRRALDAVEGDAQETEGMETHKSAGLSIRNLFGRFKRSKPMEAGQSTHAELQGKANQLEGQITGVPVKTALTGLQITDSKIACKFDSGHVLEVEHRSQIGLECVKLLQEFEAAGYPQPEFIQRISQALNRPVFKLTPQKPSPVKPRPEFGVAEQFHKSRLAQTTKEFLAAGQIKTPHAKVMPVANTNAPETSASPEQGPKAKAPELPQHNEPDLDEIHGMSGSDETIPTVEDEKFIADLNTQREIEDAQPEPAAATEIQMPKWVGERVKVSSKRVDESMKRFARDGYKLLTVTPTTGDSRSPGLVYVQEPDFNVMQWLHSGHGTVQLEMNIADGESPESIAASSEQTPNSAPAVAAVRKVYIHATTAGEKAYSWAETSQLYYAAISGAEKQTPAPSPTEPSNEDQGNEPTTPGADQPVQTQEADKPRGMPLVRKITPPKAPGHDEEHAPQIG